LAAEIEEKTGSRPTLKKGSGGVFEVTVDGRLVFSKKALGRFPEHDEVLSSLTR